MGRFSGSASRPRVGAALPRLAANIRAVRVPDLGRFSGSASRPRVGAALPRLPVAGPSRLAATIRAMPVPAMGRFIGSASRPTRAQRVAAGLQRRQHQRPLLRRQPRPQQQRTVVVAVAAHIARLVLGPAQLVAQHRAKTAHDPLQLRRRRVARDHHQLALRLGRRHPRQRPHLRITQLATRERRPDLRQPPKRPRHPQLLARRRRAQPTAVGQPLRTRPTTPPRPALAAVELPHQQQPTARRRIDVSRLPRDLALQPVDRHRPQPRHPGGRLRRRFLNRKRTHVPTRLGWTRGGVADGTSPGGGLVGAWAAALVRAEVQVSSEGRSRGSSWGRCCVGIPPRG